MNYNIGALFTCVFLVLCFSCKKPIPMNRRVNVQGEIVKVFYLNSGSCRVKFKDTLGIDHIGYYIHKIPQLRLGEKYLISYDKNDIDEIKVHFTFPIITDSINYIHSKGIVTWDYLNDFDNSNDCKFTYSYRGRRYKRYQMLVDKKIKKGDIVNILINKNRPEIAYIKGNKAITK